MSKNDIFDRIMQILDFYISISMVSEEEIDEINALERAFYEAKE